MKYLLLLIIMLQFFYALPAQEQPLTPVSIVEAVQKKMINYKVYGSWDSDSKDIFVDAVGQYTGKCMTIVLQSNIDSALYIIIPNGLMLMCNDTTVQDMVVTRQLYVELPARKNKTFQCYAMCSEYHDGMPSKQTPYKVGGLADTNLVLITKTIEEMYMQNVVGQGAVWAYTDSAIKEDLLKYGATEASVLMTIDLLNKANVITRLNPPVHVDTLPVDSAFVNKEALSLQTDYDDAVLVSMNGVYIAGGTILLLLGSTIYLLFRKRKNNNEKKTSDSV